MFDFLEKIRSKPGHVRLRIAYGTAAAATAVVAAGWLVVISTSDIFTLANPTVAAANSAGQSVGSAVGQAKSGWSELLGAAAAFNTGTSAPNIVVETSASTTLDAPTPTVIPF